MTDVSRANAQNRISQVVGNTAATEALRRGTVPGTAFKTLLDEQLSKNSPLLFSKHARERVDQRGIELTDTLLKSLGDAVSMARDKGAKDVVVIDAKQAFIVNIPNNVVITTMTGSEMKENVFTNIDSAVII
ncbi:MAG: flagellar biosynthesis protein [Clostridiales bacterium]|nr:flagellar biosynthesis protein [Clostridiales bacterium]